DREEAFKWYKKAAKRGDPEAQYDVGRAFELGDGCRKNISAAFRWYEKAAKNGNSFARQIVTSAGRKSGHNGPSTVSHPTDFKKRRRPWGTKRGRSWLLNPSAGMFCHHGGGCAPATIAETGLTGTQSGLL